MVGVPSFCDSQHNFLHNSNAAKKDNRHTMAQVDFFTPSIWWSLFPGTPSRNDYDWHGFCSKFGFAHTILQNKSNTKNKIDNLCYPSSFIDCAQPNLLGKLSEHSEYHRRPRVPDRFYPKQTRKRTASFHRRSGFSDNFLYTQFPASERADKYFCVGEFDCGACEV